MASARSSTLRSTADAFCKALLSPPPPFELLSAYFSSLPKITEHGPAWATHRLPFLGKTFVGKDSCIQYFEVLAKVLEMHLPDDAFPDKQGFIVDVEADMVSVVGKGHFSSKKTGKGWDEQFIYRFSDFDGDGKLGHWEIWADPLSAWQAVGPEAEVTSQGSDADETLAQQHVKALAAGDDTGYVERSEAAADETLAERHVKDISA